MSPNGRVLILLMLLGVLGPAHVTAAPLDDVDECAERLDDAPAKEKTLAQICPELDRALNDTGFTTQLDVDERVLKKPEVLWDLAALGRRYGGTPGAVPSTAALPGIADAVNGKVTTAPAGWWDKVRGWLREWFSKHAPSQGSWLDRWFQDLGKSTRFLNVVSYVCMGLVILAAVVVVINELRAIGVLRRRRNGVSETAHVGPDLALLAPGDTRSGVGRLLAELVRRLVETGRLRAARTLTHRELIRRTALDTSEQKNVFARVALAAESVTYGPAGTVVPDELMEQGNSLLAEMAAAAPRGPE